jgi:predicted RNA-binding protein (virulence factor B family)
MMKTGEILEARMLRIEPDAIVLENAGGGLVYLKPDLRQPFVAGKKLSLFISHQDAEGRFQGSTQLPLLALGEVEFLQVHSVSRAGVFFEWGPDKPLFCPEKWVLGSPRPGMMLPVRLLEDARSSGLIGNMQWKANVRAADEEFVKGREVEILVMETHELGFSVLADHFYQGMLYSDQVFQSLRPGLRLKAWVNALRPDGKLDILLRKPGYSEVENAADALLEKLRQAGGRLPLGDKSAPDVIYSALSMSKKVFKKAAGALYKEGKICLSDTAVWLQDGVDD